MEYQHGGDIYTNQVELDYSANLNPLGLPEGVKNAYIGAADCCSVYPDSRCQALRTKLADYHRIGREAVLCGNGAAELIFLIVQAKRPKRALLIAPSFLEYEQALKAAGCGLSWFDLKEEEDFALSVPELLVHLKEAEAAGQRPDILFLCNPNNPTGFAVEREALIPLLEYCEERGIVCVVDECFIEFLDEPERFSVMKEVRSGRFRRLFILKAFTKLYAMAGLRYFSGPGTSGSNGRLSSAVECLRSGSVGGRGCAWGDGVCEPGEGAGETGAELAEGADGGPGAFRLRFQSQLSVFQGSGAGQGPDAGSPQPL